MKPIYLLLTVLGGAVASHVAGCQGGDGGAGTTGAGGAGTTGAGTTGAGGAGGSGAAGGGVVCGGAGAEGDPMERFCNAVGDPFCEALFGCCSDPAVLAEYGGTVEACKQQWAACPTWGQEMGLADLLASGMSVLDDAKLDACACTLTAMAAGGAACDRPPRSFLTTECWTAFEGQVPAGGACSVEYDLSFVECEEGLCVDGGCVPFVKYGLNCHPYPSPGDQTCNFTEGYWCNHDDHDPYCDKRFENDVECFPNGETLACVSGFCNEDSDVGFFPTCSPPPPEALCSAAKLHW